jgi:hypothetical protein
MSKFSQGAPHVVSGTPGTFVAPAGTNFNLRASNFGFAGNAGFGYGGPAFNQFGQFVGPTGVTKVI